MKEAAILKTLGAKRSVVASILGYELRHAGSDCRYYRRVTIGRIVVGSDGVHCKIRLALQNYPPGMGLADGGDPHHPDWYREQPRCPAQQTGSNPAQGGRMIH